MNKLEEDIEKCISGYSLEIIAKTEEHSYSLCFTNHQIKELYKETDIGIVMFSLVQQVTEKFIDTFGSEPTEITSKLNEQDMKVTKYYVAK